MSSNSPLQDVASSVGVKEDRVFAAGVATKLVPEAFCLALHHLTEVLVLRWADRSLVDRGAIVVADPLGGPGVV
jgi:hypothetical protein